MTTVICYKYDSLDRRLNNPGIMDSKNCMMPSFIGNSIHPIMSQLPLRAVIHPLRKFVVSAFGYASKIDQT